MILNNGQLKVTLVTNYPPTIVSIEGTSRPVSEYALHLVKALGDNPYVSEVHVLADIIAGEPKSTRQGKVVIERCWNFDSYDIPLSILSKVRSISPDLCWFNITLGSFGMTITNFIGVLTPHVLKVAGYPVLITLHNIVDLYDTSNVKYQGGLLTIMGARIATKILCKAGHICVMLPEYLDILRSRYRATSTSLIPHGTLGTPTYQTITGESQEKTLLSFGIYGTHKKLETTLEAMRQIGNIDPSIKLLIVGTANVHAPGYMEQVQKAYGALPNVEFRGYVPEGNIPSVFAECSAVILLNQSCGGESGALMQAGMYGKAVIAPNFALFKGKEKQGYTINYMDVMNPKSIRDAILSLFTKGSEELSRQGLQNFIASSGIPMSSVVNQYLTLIQEKL